MDEARRSIREIFGEVDVADHSDDAHARARNRRSEDDPEALRPAELKLLRNTRPFNVWGLPAISVPCGFTQSGLPIGLQIAGPHWREDLVLRLAHATSRQRLAQAALR